MSTLSEEQYFEIQKKILKVLFLGQLLLEANDDLADTPFFKQQLKHNCNKLNKSVEGIIKEQLTKVYKQDPTFSTNMFNNIDSFIERVSEMEVGDYPLVNKMLDEFIKDKEYWKDNLVMEFNKVA